MDYTSNENFDNIFDLSNQPKKVAKQFFETYVQNLDSRVSFLQKWLEYDGSQFRQEDFVSLAEKASFQLLNNPVFTTGEIQITKAFSLTQEIFAERSLSPLGVSLSHDLARYAVLVFQKKLPFVSFEVGTGKYASYTKNLPVLYGKQDVWCVTEIMADFNWILRDPDQINYWNSRFNQTCGRLERI